MELSDDAVNLYSASTPGESVRARGWLGMARLHFEINRILPQSGTIADIGGGTGDTAEYLLQRGAAVELCDIVPEVVEIARKRHQGRNFSAQHASATQLPYDTDVFDASVMLGPFYHLKERESRIMALKECSRITRPGGLVVVEFMGIDHFPQWASTRINDEAALQAALSITPDGWFPGVEGGFTACHTSSAGQLKGEVKEAGLRILSLRALQGPYWPVSINGLSAPRQQASRLVRIATHMSEKESSIAISPHSIAVLQSPQA